MADKPATQAGDRDAYFARQIQTLQSQVSSLTARIAALEAKVK